MKNINIFQSMKNIVKTIFLIESSLMSNVLDKTCRETKPRGMAHSANSIPFGRILLAVQGFKI